MDKSCYKILFYIGITDMCVLWIVAFFSGYFSLTGYVYCSNPKFMYILGTLAMGKNKNKQNITNKFFIQ
jgi:hypothetical protein